MSKDKIHQAFQSGKVDKDTEKIVETTIEDLDLGKVRVAQKKGDSWQINSHVKEAILLYFKIKKMKKFSSGDFNFYDKVPLKTWSGKEGVRVVPQALVRYGSFVAKNTVLMPSYINIGAFVDEGSLIDTWADCGILCSSWKKCPCLRRCGTWRSLRTHSSFSCHH